MDDILNQAKQTHFERTKIMTINAGHTPGPWIIYQTNKDQRITDVEFSVENGFSIATIYTGDQVSIETHDSNVRLISAAPELLEALEECVEYLFNDLGKYPKESELGMKARAAIAKAKGE